MAKLARKGNGLGKCLVTGGAGFIGSHVAKELLKAGHKVVCLDNLAGGCIENVPRRAAFVRGDINDAALIGKLFREHRFDFVFHFAAFASEGLSHFVRSFTFRNNQCGTATLINAAVNRGARPMLVYASSAAVYGKAGGVLTEEISPTPCDPYGVSKLASELDLRAAADFFGLPFIIFRLHNVYGPRQNLSDPFRNVAGIFLKELLEGNRLTIYGDGLQTRQFTDVRDVASVVANSIGAPGARDEVFNLGADQSFAVVEVAKALCRAAGKKFDPVFLPARNEAMHPVCSHAKALKVFGGDVCTTSLEEGLAEMYKWALNAPRVTRGSKLAIETREKFPAHWEKDVAPETESISIAKPHSKKSPNEQHHCEPGKSRRRS